MSVPWSGPSDNTPLTFPWSFPGDVGRAAPTFLYFLTKYDKCLDPQAQRNSTTWSHRGYKTNKRQGISRIISSTTTRITLVEEVHFKMARVKEYWFECNLPKCTSFKDDVTYLDYQVNNEGRKPDPTSVEAIKRIPRPRNLKELYGKQLAKCSMT